MLNCLFFFFFFFVVVVVVVVFVYIVECSENRHKINIAPYVEYFYYSTYQDKI